MTQSIQEKASTLLDRCIDQGMPRSKVSVGLGGKTLHVYVQGRRRAGSFFCTTWKGSPVEWHWNIGPTKAFDAPGV